MSRTRARSGRHKERVIACAMVMAIHFVVAWVVTRSVENAPAPASADLQVVFIERVKPLARPVEREASASAATPHPAALPRVDSPSMPQQQNAKAQPVVATIGHQAPIPVVANDEWETPARKPANDGIGFSRNVLAGSYNPRPRPAPGRFRMKRETTPEDIVHGVS